MRLSVVLGRAPQLESQTLRFIAMVLCGGTLKDGARYESSKTFVSWVCIHSAMRCLSARLPYLPHMAHPPLTRSGTFRNTRLNISCAKSTDSSIALPVGTTLTLTCRSRIIPRKPPHPKGWVNFCDDRLRSRRHRQPDISS